MRIIAATLYAFALVLCVFVFSGCGSTLSHAAAPQTAGYSSAHAEEYDPTRWQTPSESEAANALREACSQSAHVTRRRAGFNYTTRDGQTMHVVCY
tara:strand:+ start:12345 stop:12632 length:288 start_codon:yes stop_codon:yes gene_type:complete